MGRERSGTTSAASIVTYSVKKMYYTLQGEGAQTGRPAVFLRLAGCNLWTGREKDRYKAICKFCDTQFVGTDGPDGRRDAKGRLFVLYSRYSAFTWGGE